jgi:hypothetical protein
MPLFFLHVRDGGRLMRDPDGSCVHGLEAARHEAIASARELMAHSIVGEGRIGIERSIEICDARGATVLVLPFRQAVAT